jgi:hypothetical protein
MSGQGELPLPRRMMPVRRNWFVVMRNKRKNSGLLVRYGCPPDDYTKAAGTSREVLRNKGIKSNHFRSSLGTYTHLELEGKSGSQVTEFRGPCSLGNEARKLPERLHKVCANLSFGFSGTRVFVPGPCPGNHSAEELILLLYGCSL